MLACSYLGCRFPRLNLCRTFFSASCCDSAYYTVTQSISTQDVSFQTNPNACRGGRNWHDIDQVSFIFATIDLRSTYYIIASNFTTIRRVQTMTRLVVLHTLLLALAQIAVIKSLPARCGSCWCIYEGESATCPSPPDGIVDSFDDNAMKFYSTFQLTNSPDFLKLQTSTGQPCYPFANTVGPLSRYPNSNLPQCAEPVSTNETVCAYLYENNTSCSGRKYQIVTYASATAAQAAGAIVTHKGGESIELVFW